MDPALRRVAELKPPAGGGLLQFEKDAFEYYTLEEQKALWRSAAGQQIGHALHRCEGHSKQWLDARRKFEQQAKLAKNNANVQETEFRALKRDAVMKKLKYVDCLAYMVCPKEWNVYTRCWVQTVGNMSQNELSSYKEQGALGLICRAPKDSLERCVGELVSGAVQAGDSLAIEEDLVPIPLDNEE